MGMSGMSGMSSNTGISGMNGMMSGGGMSSMPSSMPMTKSEFWSVFARRIVISTPIMQTVCEMRWSGRITLPEFGSRTLVGS